MDRVLEERIASLSQSSPLREILNNQALLPLRQKIGDIGKQAMVTASQIMGFNLALETHWQLVRNITNSKNITVPAFAGTMILRMIINHQQQGNKLSQDIDATGDQMLAAQAQMMREEAVPLYEGSLQAGLSYDGIVTNFDSMLQHYGEVRIIKAKALKEAKSQNIGLASMITQMDSINQQQQLGEQARPLIQLEVSPSTVQ